MRYKAVLFDMDGTVLDTLADLTNAINHTLSDYGMPLLDKRRVAQYLGNGAAHLMARAVPEGTPDALREEMLRAYQPWYDSHCAILTAPYPGIVPLMQALPDAVLAALREMGVEKRDAVYVGDTEVDLRTAENAGLACAVVGWGFRTEEQLRAAGAGHIFQNAAELRDWLLE